MLDKRIVVYIIENIYETSILPNDWQELKKSLGALTKKTPGWTTLSTLNHTKTATSVLMSWNDAQIVLGNWVL